MRCFSPGTQARYSELLKSFMWRMDPDSRSFDFFGVLSWDRQCFWDLSLALNLCEMTARSPSVPPLCPSIRRPYIKEIPLYLGSVCPIHMSVTPPYILDS